MIRSATGKDDPVSVHPVIILRRMNSTFGTVVTTNLLLKPEKDADIAIAEDKPDTRVHSVKPVKEREVIVKLFKHNRLTALVSLSIVVTFLLFSGPAEEPGQHTDLPRLEGQINRELTRVS
jgi:hypothetical protein